MRETSWPFCIVTHLEMWRQKHRRYTVILSGLIGLLMMTACSQIPSATDRRKLADTLVAERGWISHRIKAGPFDLMSYYPRQIPSGATLTIYIEGDGNSWITPSRPSLDPTPLDPVGLRLALAQPQGQAAYLARPCQFVRAQREPCAQRYWTTARFAANVVNSSNLAIDILKQRFGAQRLTLVGYSGGAAVAALVAARRSDVGRLITVAGNLDPSAWSTLHAIAPLIESLEPVKFIYSLQSIEQWHFAGDQDSVVPPRLVQGFVKRFSPSTRSVIQIEPGFDHHCCWVEQWPRLWRTATGEH